MQTARSAASPPCGAQSNPHPHTSSHNPRTSTHQATHIHCTSTHCATLNLPPCNATLLTRLAAARRFAALQCHPTGAPRSRSALCRPAMPRFGAASSVGRERLVLVAALLPLAQSQRSSPPPSSPIPLPCWRSPHRGYWWHRGSTLRAINPSRASHFFATHAHRAPLASLRSAAGARRATHPAPAKQPCFCRARAGHP